MNTICNCSYFWGIWRNVLLTFAISTFQVTYGLTQSIEQGLVIAPSIHIGTSPGVRGTGIEFGYYLLKKFGDRAMISLDARWRRANWTDDSDGIFLSQRNSTVFDSIQILRTGKAEIQRMDLNFPVKLRYHFLRDRPFYALLGFAVSIAIDQEASWEYSEIIRNNTTNTDIRTDNLYEELKPNSIGRTFPIIGLGYSRERLRVETELRLESLDIDHEYVRASYFPPMAITILYRLSKDGAEWKESKNDQ